MIASSRRFRQVFQTTNPFLPVEFRLSLAGAQDSCPFKPKVLAFSGAAVSNGLPAFGRRKSVLRQLLWTLVFAVLGLNAAFAQSWPTRQIQTIVPQSPGSALDLVTRALMEQVAVLLGQPVIVENRTGAGNTIAMAAAARAEPDGYTLLANSSTHSLAPVMYSTLTFDTFRDLTPIIPFGNTPMVMMVATSKGYKNVAEFVAAAKAKRGAMNYSSGGAGGITHLAMEAFRLAAGFEAVHVPFRGAPEALTEVLSERADFYFSPLPAALPFLKDGKLQALAVSGSQRASALPDVPTHRRGRLSRSHL